MLFLEGENVLLLTTGYQVFSHPSCHLGQALQVAASTVRVGDRENCGHHQAGYHDQRDRKQIIIINKYRYINK